MWLNRANSCPFCGVADAMTHRYYCPEADQSSYVPPFALLVSLFIAGGVVIGTGIVWLVH